jgi:hypothetical protein
MSDLSAMSLEDLTDLQTKLSVERAEASRSIKDQQLEVQVAIDQRVLVDRAKNFSDDELKTIMKHRKEHSEAEAEAPAESEVTE